jgi:hypothetical protein
VLWIIALSLACGVDDRSVAVVSQPDETDRTGELDDGRVAPPDVPETSRPESSPDKPGAASLEPTMGEALPVSRGDEEGDLDADSEEAAEADPAERPPSDEMPVEEPPVEEPPVEEPPPVLTLQELVGSLDGHLFTAACGDLPNADDCSVEGWRSNGGPLNVCVGGRFDAVIDFPVGGEPGAVYDVAMHVYGVMEPRNYGNVVTRDASGSPSRAAGGSPTPFASMAAGAGNYLSTGDNNYTTYELHVLDAAGQERRVHFFNADTQTGHYTFGISYEKTIELIGGGSVVLQVQSANCRIMKNCGNGGFPCMGKTRSIDISAADPPPQNGSLIQPGLGKNPEHSGQWFLLDALSFEAR